MVRGSIGHLLKSNWFRPKTSNAPSA